jgi:hypothetical protein
MAFKEHEAPEFCLGQHEGLCFMAVTFLAAVVQFTDQFLQLVGLVF